MQNHIKKLTRMMADMMGPITYVSERYLAIGESNLLVRDKVREITGAPFLMVL